MSGNAQTGAVGAELAESLVVRLVDDNGNGVGGKAISWVIGTGGGSPSPATATTNPNGFAWTRWTLGPNAGSNSINAVFSAVTCRRCRSPRPPKQGEATKLTFTQAPVTTSAGSTMPAVRVAIQDASGNTVTSATAQVTLAIGANPGSGTLSGTTTVERRQRCSCLLHALDRQGRERIYARPRRPPAWRTPPARHSTS